MIGKTVKKFWDNYDALPEGVKILAKKAYTQWQENPYHPALNFEPLRGSVWSARVGQHYRALCRKQPEMENGQEVFVWHWIGTHAEYDRLIKRN